MNDESKHDPSIHDNTLKGIAGLTTNPIPVDDGESTAKVFLNIYLLRNLIIAFQEAKLVTSAFDRTKYQTKKGVVQNIAVYMITSNIMFRSVNLATHSNYSYSSHLQDGKNW